MNKNLLTYLSHNFCVNCCGDAKKLNCDSKNVTCDKLASFLIGCDLYKEPIDGEKLNDIALTAAIEYNKELDNSMTVDQEYWYQQGYYDGYKKTMED